MRLIKRSYVVLRTFGVVELGRRIGEYAIPPRRMTIRDLTPFDSLVARDPWMALSSLMGECDGDAIDRDSYDAYVREWEELERTLDRGSITKIPSEYDVEGSTAKVLYVLVRWRRPRVILETGIARGFSSFALLTAVQANGFGIVHSCDVDPAAGEFVNAGLRDDWIKHVIDARDAKTAFALLVDSLEDIDFFFHDSNHREKWMEFEFQTVLPRMSAGAILGSDDVDLNHAFLSVIPSCSKSVILLDSRKASAFGVVKP
ncbi:class I SAM-dependent methyltransferase [bacterium]|nr:class I SAM-dependent methyltransferase [bacterium]